MKPQEASFIIVPGWMDSGPGHWQTIWQKKLQCERVAQHDWMHPVRVDWIAALNEMIERSSAPLLLVAHSLGCNTVSEWASSYSKTASSKIRAALLVAPPDLEKPGTPREILDFLPVTKKNLPFQSLLVASTTDPYAAIERSRLLAAAWGSEFVDVGDSGHINTDAGFGTWPEGEKLLNRLHK